MIDFRVRETGVSLDLFPDTVVSLEINNPLFNTDALTGTFSYPLDLPLTDKNRKELKYPESLLNINSASPSFDIDYYYGGILFKQGILKILKITDRISITFISGVGAINDLITGRKLNSVNYGEDVFFPASDSIELEFVSYLPASDSAGLHPSAPMHLTVNTTYAGITTQFSKALTGFTGSSSEITALAILFNSDSAGLAAHHITGVVTDINEAVLPYFYRLRFEMEPDATISLNMDENPAGSSFKYKSSVFKVVPSVSVEPKVDFMKSIASLSYPDTNYTFFPVKNTGFYGDSNPDFLGYINFYNVSLEKFGLNVTTDTLRSCRNITPFPFFIHIFKSILSEINYLAKGSFVKNEEIQKIVIYNTVALDSILFDSSTPDTIVLNKWAESFNLKNHVPDIDITDFLKFVKSFFCIGYFVDDSKKTVEVITLKEVLESTNYQDLTSITSTLKEIDLNDGQGYTLKLPASDDQYIKDNVKDLSSYTKKDPVVNSSDLDLLDDQQDKDVRYVSSLDEYWSLKQVYDGTTITNLWSKFSDNYYDLKVGKGINEVPLNANTLLMISEDRPSGGKWLIPVCNEEGSSKEFEIGDNNKDKLRFLIYRGFQNTTTGHAYPFGTNGYKDASGTTIGSLSLKLDDPNYGMNTKFFSSWLQFIANTKPVITKTNFDLTQLMDVKLLSQKSRIREVEMLINKINVNMTMHKILPATVQYYKV